MKNLWWEWVYLQKARVEFTGVLRWEWRHRCLSTRHHFYLSILTPSRRASARLGRKRRPGSSFRRFSGWNFAIIGRGLCVCVIRESDLIQLYSLPLCCWWWDRYLCVWVAGNNGIFFARDAKYLILYAQNEDYFMHLFAYGWHEIMICENSDCIAEALFLIKSFEEDSLNLHCWLYSRILYIKH